MLAEIESLKCVFIIVVGRREEGEKRKRERKSPLWLTMKAEAGLGRGWEPGPQVCLPVSVADTQALEPLLIYCFPGCHITRSGNGEQKKKTMRS